MESSVTQILLVEDSPDDAILVRRALERERRAPDTVTSVREAEPRVPIVVFTVAGDEEVAVRALQAGARD